MRQNIVLVALSALGVVRAQQQQQNYTVNIGGIDSGLKSMFRIRSFRPT